jgi:predicted DNA binding CopG/RHH family protein
MSDNDTDLKQPGALRTDEEAERFVDEADLTEYDLSGFRPVHFEFEEKSAQVNMRMPQRLLDAIKDRAKARGIPYQRYIRETLENALHDAGK